MRYTNDGTVWRIMLGCGLLYDVVEVDLQATGKKEDPTPPWSFPYPDIIYRHLKYNNKRTNVSSSSVERSLIVPGATLLMNPRRQDRDSVMMMSMSLRA
jgi:hypothetical protein